MIYNNYNPTAREHRLNHRTVAAASFIILGLAACGNTKTDQPLVVNYSSFDQSPLSPNNNPIKSVMPKIGKEIVKLSQNPDSGVHVQQLDSGMTNLYGHAPDNSTRLSVIMSGDNKVVFADLQYSNLTPNNHGTFFQDEVTLLEAPKGNGYAGFAGPIVLYPLNKEGDVGIAFKSRGTNGVEDPHSVEVTDTAELSVYNTFVGDSVNPTTPDDYARVVASYAMKLLPKIEEQIKS